MKIIWTLEVEDKQPWEHPTILTDLSGSLETALDAANSQLKAENKNIKLKSINVAVVSR